MTDTILTTLREEHRQVEELIARIERSEDVVQKKELYLQLKEELIPHMEGEEQTLYAHLLEDINDEEAEELALHADEEHQVVKDLFAKLDNLGIEGEEWTKSFALLKENVRRHVEEEESALFTEAKEDFSKEELIEFNEEFEEVKHQVDLG